MQDRRYILLNKGVRKPLSFIGFHFRDATVEIFQIYTSSSVKSRAMRAHISTANLLNMGEVAAFGYFRREEIKVYTRNIYHGAGDGREALHKVPRCHQVRPQMTVTMAGFFKAVVPHSGFSLENRRIY